MIVLEFKAYGKPSQHQAVAEAIRTAQFIRNSCLRLWMDGLGIGKNDLQKYCALLAQKFPFAKELNSMARQASAERAWVAIKRFFTNCKQGLPGSKGFPKFQKHCRSVEYKTSGWKLADDCKSITFTDGKNIGRLKLKGTRGLHFYQLHQIKRVRLVKRADGIYVQMCIQIDRQASLEPTGEMVGLDVGLQEYYTDSSGAKQPNPTFLKKAEVKLKRAQRLVSRKQKGSHNRAKARRVLGKHHLKISRQRKDHAVKLARCVVTSNDVVVYEDLRIKNMVKNHCLAKAINDASWYQFREWVEYFAQVFGRLAIPVNPQYTSQECSSCGAMVKKSLSTRTHICQCGCVLDRDHNAARNILSRGLATVGHTGSGGLEPCNAWGDGTNTHAGESLFGQVLS
jgi:putative transposase